MNLFCFHPEAESEMNEAAAWYETQQHNLGRRFLKSVQDARNRIQVQTQLFPIVESDVRRCLTKTFPFGVLFRIKPAVIVIMAVMHLHRDPDYWRNQRFEPGAPPNGGSTAPSGDAGVSEGPPSVS